MVLLKNLNEHSTVSPSYSALWGYTAPNGREYAILGCRTGTAFVDITDSLNIHEVGFVPTVNPTSSGNMWREMKTYSHYAYIVSEVDSSGIQIVDLQYLPDSIRYVGRKLLPNHRKSHTISQEGPYLYLNGNNAELGTGVTIVDLSIDPENPIIRSSWNADGSHDSRVLRDTIYVCNGGDKILIVDARDKSNPVTLTSFYSTPVPIPHNCALTSDGNYLYSTDETVDGKLKIWDIHDIYNPILIRRYIPPAVFNQDIVHNVEISGNYAIIAYYTAGVQVLDISNPSNPVLVAFYDTFDGPSNVFDGCWAVYRFPSGKIIASDVSKGLFVFRLQHSVTAFPSANFISSTTTIRSGDQINFFDISSGNPTSWSWAITGPENFSSVSNAPTFTFNTIGTYSVKLRVSNSMGADSVVRNNFINVNAPAFKPFDFTSPLYFTINTAPADTSKFTFTWSKTGTNPYFNYKLKLRKVGSTVDRIFTSGNNGRDTTISFRKSFLDSLGRELGFTSDSARLTGRIYAYNSVDSLASISATIFFIRTSVGIDNISTEIPEEYKLYNNYPNPFNPATKIKFDLKAAGFTSIKIYDINGRELQNLINEKLSAGTYEYDFHAAHLPSGVYFYKLESNGYVSTKKMTLIK